MLFIEALKVLESIQDKLVNNDNEKEFLELCLKECKSENKTKHFFTDILTNDFNMKERSGYLSTFTDEIYYDHAYLGYTKNLVINIAKIVDKVAKTFAKSEFKKAYQAIRADKTPKTYIERKAAKAFSSFWRVESQPCNVLFHHLADFNRKGYEINTITRTVKIAGRATKLFNY